MVGDVGDGFGPGDETLPGRAEVSGAATRDSRPSRSLSDELMGRLESAAGSTDRDGTASAPRIGPFSVLKRVGHGGMGTVFAAYDERLERKVALKLFRRDDDDQSRARVLREAQALARLSHPNVIGIFETGEQEGRLYMAMEFIDGQDLETWQQERRPSLDEILKVYVQAGRGLAAAHAAGLVHRDFKPQNAMIDDTSRVRVLDFGLARKHSLEPTDDSGQPELAASALPLDATLTRTGAMVGTPAYMAPEQMMGSRIDARADQFAFCVALWKAALGQHPFGGDSAHALVASVTTGALVPPPRGSPKWLVEILARGLNVDPDERWESMDALLHRLGVSAGRRRRRVAVTVAGAALVAAGLAWAAFPSSKPSCDDGVHLVDAAWNPERRASVREALSSTGVPYADATADAVDENLAKYAQRWIAEHRQACLDARDHGQSDKLLAARYACLDRRRAALKAFIESVERAPTQVVEHAVVASAQLGSPARCSDVEHVLAEVVTPENEDVAAQVERLRSRVAELESVRLSGDYARAAQLADALVADIEQVDYPPIKAQVYVQASNVAREQGKLEEGLSLAEDAYVEAHDAPRTVAARVHRTLSNGYSDLEQVREALREARRGHAIVERSARVDAQELGTSHQALGVALLAARDYEGALQSLERAHELFVGELGSDHPQIAAVHLNLGAVKLELAKHDETLEHYREALRIWTDHLGPDHPNVALVHNNLGPLFRALGRYDEAASSLGKAIEITTAIHGETHPHVARALANLGIVHLARGDLDTAQRVLNDALRLARALPEPSPGIESSALSTLGAVEARQGRYDAARERFEEAIAIEAAHLGPDASATTDLRTHVALLAGQRGDFERALSISWQVLEARQREPSTNPAHIADARSNVALFLAATGDCAQAYPHIEAGLEFWKPRMAPGDWGYDWLCTQTLVQAFCAAELDREEDARRDAEHAKAMLAVLSDEELSRAYSTLASAVIADEVTAEQAQEIAKMIPRLDAPIRAIVERWRKRIEN